MTTVPGNSVQIHLEDIVLEKVDIHYSILFCYTKEATQDSLCSQNSLVCVIPVA